MQRSISVMIGKGSVSHNSRTFTAENVDAVRTKNNVVFCSDNIKQVYHDLFDAALQQYNEKQVREDRKILDYYEKIRTGKQEKLFHEVIFQIGNKDDMNARGENGEHAKIILIEFMSKFQERNSNLRVFSAHLHMDEETPHLHIDFVPFTTGSKRGLETRVSLKKALEQQGFVGGSRSETEWNKWVQSEKNNLAEVMERHDVLWKKLDTNMPHLSVLDYKKQERTKEVIELEKELENINSDIEYFTVNAKEYAIEPRWQVPTPQKMQSANKYMETIVVPFVNKLKAVIKTILQKYIDLRGKHRHLENDFNKVKQENITLGKMWDTALKDYKDVSQELKESTGRFKMRKTDYEEIIHKMNKER